MQNNCIFNVLIKWSNSQFKTFDLWNIQKKSCWCQFSNIYFSCLAASKKVKSTCPGLKLVHYWCQFSNIQLIHSFEISTKIYQHENSDVHRGKEKNAHIVLLYDSSPFVTYFYIKFFHVNLLKLDVLSTLKTALFQQIIFKFRKNSYKIHKKDCIL